MCMPIWPASALHVGNPPDISLVPYGVCMWKAIHSMYRKWGWHTTYPAPFLSQGMVQWLLNIVSTYSYCNHLITTIMIYNSSFIVSIKLIYNHWRCIVRLILYKVVHWLLTTSLQYCNHAKLQLACNIVIFICCKNCIYSIC